MNLLSRATSRFMTANNHALDKPLKPITTPTKRTMTNYTISITSDINCPWCYIGHTRLSRAIANHQARYPSDTFSLKYVPFYLTPPPPGQAKRPPFPVESQNRHDRRVQLYGPARAKQVEMSLRAAAQKDGLDFTTGGMTGPSRNGHRLVHYAGKHGGERAQHDVLFDLWKRYFEREVDITKLEVLVEVGVAAGLGSEEEIKTFLESGEDGEEVDRLAEEARGQGVSGVPFFLVQDMWGVGGAQEPEAFEMLFKRYKQMQENEAVKSKEGEGLNGQACAIDGKGCL